MEGVCVTCLSKGRRLSPVQAVECASVLGFNFPVPGRLCWECKAMLTKFIAFRQQAMTAQQTLIMLGNVCQLETDIKSLSKLSWHHTNMNSSDTEVSQVNVKKEVIYESDNNVEEHIETNISEKVMVLQNTIEVKVKIEQIHDTNPAHNVADTKFIEPETSTNTETNIIQPNYIIRTLSMDELKVMRAEERVSSRYVKSPHKCETCIISYNNKKILDTHRLDLHSENLSHECNLCQQRFNCKESLESHYRAHFRCYDCTKCSFRHTRCDLVIKHYAEKHCGRVYECKECQIVFVTSRQMMYHANTRHKELPRCSVPLCGKIFRNNFTLQNHMKTHSKDIPRQKCPICFKMINVICMKNMRRHMSLHDATEKDKQKDKEWVHWCEVCQKGFAAVKRYEQHMKYAPAHIQPELLKFECHDCGKRTHKKSCLSEHIQTAHLKKADHVCVVCSKAFTTLRLLRCHQRRSHSGQPASSDHVCELCGKAFRHKISLREHMNMHSGARPYKCAVCEDTFSYSASLYTHNRLKHLKIKRKKTKTKDAGAEECTSE